MENIAPHLLEEEAVNSLFLGYLTTLAADPPSEKIFMATVLQENKIRLAALYCQFNLILSHGPKYTIPFIVEELSREQWQIPGVIGPNENVEAFRSLWVNITKCDFKLAMQQRIYKLTKVQTPLGIPGEARMIQSSDVPKVAEWLQAFHQDAGLPGAPNSLEKDLKNAETRVIERRTYFWIVKGEPVCMAAQARPSPNGITINAVFTPKEHRCRGYASALVAKLSQQSLDEGKKFCVLYTDLNNPTSNSIYQKVGYEPVCDSINYKFDYSEKSTKA